MGVIKIKNENGEIIGLPAIKGANGKSAYAFAKEAGYTGTEEEFASSLANSANKLGVEHNTDPNAHADIRALLDAQGIGEELNSILDIKDTSITKDILLEQTSHGTNRRINFDNMAVGDKFTEQQHISEPDYGDLDECVEYIEVHKGDVIDFNVNSRFESYYGGNRYGLVVMDDECIITDIIIDLSSLDNFTYTVEHDGYICMDIPNDHGATPVYKLVSSYKTSARLDALEEVLDIKTDTEETIITINTVSGNGISIMDSNMIHLSDPDLAVGNQNLNEFLYGYPNSDERLVYFDNVYKGNVIDLNVGNKCDNLIEGRHGIVMQYNGIITNIINVSDLKANNYKYTVPHDGNIFIFTCFNGDTILKILTKAPRLGTNQSPLVLDPQYLADYNTNPIYGDEALDAILKGRQIVVRVANADGGNYTAIFSPIYMYQIPNYANDYLYLFYLKDEKQNIDLSGMGMGVIQMPIYGELKMKLSKKYYYNPL